MPHPTRRLLLAATASLAASPALAQGDWRSRFREIRYGTISSEQENVALARHEGFAKYMTARLGVPVRVFKGTDYAAVIEALRANTAEFAYLGPAAYARAREVIGERIEPVALTLDDTGGRGYFSIIVVKADSPYQTVEDLRGRSLAYADPNSTSGYQVPVYFLRKQGIDPARFFSRTGFAGNHEQGVTAMLNGTFDAAATHHTNERRGNIPRMVEKGLIPAGSTRTIWQSGLIPNSPFVVRMDLPEEMRRLWTEALLEFETAEPEAFRAYSAGTAQGIVPARHEDYLDIMAVIRENAAARRTRS